MPRALPARLRLPLLLSLVVVPLAVFGVARTSTPVPHGAPGTAAPCAVNGCDPDGGLADHVRPVAASEPEADPGTRLAASELPGVAPVSVAPLGERAGADTARHAAVESRSVAGPATAAAAPAASASFDGLGNIDGVYPPDTSGDVGPSYYVEWVNDHFAVYDKQGHQLMSVPGNQLFSGVGGPCETANEGDPIVKYDARVDRWLIGQFAWSSTSGPYYECLAMSKTSDPRGAYWLYPFETSALDVMDDYPKIGLWDDMVL